MRSVLFFLISMGVFLPKVVFAEPAVRPFVQHEILFAGYAPHLYYSAAMHNPVAISPARDAIEIEDGSVWRTNPADRYKAYTWLANDPILITQTHRWFSQFNYALVNQRTSESIEADLHLGPIQNGPYTRYIIGIDTGRGELYLNDNTHWEIHRGDQGTFCEWKYGDPLIIGYNSYWWSSQYEGLLINVALNNHIRARQY